MSASEHLRLSLDSTASRAEKGVVQWRTGLGSVGCIMRSGVIDQDDRQDVAVSRKTVRAALAPDLTGRRSIRVGQRGRAGSGSDDASGHAKINVDFDQSGRQSSICPIPIHIFGAQPLSFSGPP